ncbi:MAG: VOC family protein [Anaerolineae bacterium]|nr:VOC family protein [Anaerolineae bacterium]
MTNYTLNAYLHFNGNAEEVLNFYQSVFGGKLIISRYGDNPGANVAEGFKNQVMHGDLVSESIRLMASDSGPMGEGIVGTNFSLSLSGPDRANLKSFYERLIEGGTVAVPLAASPWGDEFGMFSDKFGVSWMLNITKA